MATASGGVPPSYELEKQWREDPARVRPASPARRARGPGCCAHSHPSIPTSYRRKKYPTFSVILFSGSGGDRTHDLILKRDPLYQLSYRPIFYVLFFAPGGNPAHSDLPRRQGGLAVLGTARIRALRFLSDIRRMSLSCAWGESNPHQPLRRRSLYPLSYRRPTTL